MLNFSYKAVDKNGVIKKGTIVSNDFYTAQKTLKEKGLFVITLKKNSFNLKKKIKLSELAFFCEYLSILLSSGIPLLAALDILKKELKNVNLKNALEIIKKDLQAGEQLYISLKKHPQLFPKILLSLVEAGEYAGTLDEIFKRLSKYFYYEHKTLQKIKNSLTYPFLVLLVAFGAIILIFTFVIPSFSGLLKDLEVELPFITELFIKFSNNFVSKWYIFPLFLLTFPILFIKVYSTNKGKLFWDKLFLKVPIVGDLIKKIHIIRFTKTLGTLLNSGIALLDALEIASKTLDNQYFLESLKEIKRAIKNGQSLTDSFKKVDFSSPLLTQIITIGEETAQLSELLIKVGDYYEEEVNIKVEKILSLIEPVLLIFLSLLVFLIVFTIVLPIFSILGALS